MKKTKVFLLIFIISIIGFLTSRYILEPDYFWHIKAGEYMFKNGFLTHDVFSWFMSGKYWMSHEWLFEIILYLFKLVFGKYHVLVYSFITLSTLFSILYIPNRNKISKNIFYTLIYLVLFVALSIGFVQARPHMISYSLIALTIYLCFDLFNNKNSKKIYFLPIISIIWANVHGGSSNLSYIFPIIFLLCGLVKFKFSKMESDRLSKLQIKKFIIITLLCVIGVCINIHGFKMFIYPYENMLDTTMISSINEWMPTSLSDVYHYIYYIYLLFIVMTMLISSRKIKLIDFILLLFVTYLGLKSIRFWLYSPIVMSYIMFDYVKEYKVMDEVIYVFSMFIAIILGLTIFDFTRVNLTYKLKIDDELVKVINEQHPIRLFNMYDYGGELIYKDVKVFIDGRADLYSKYNLQDYLDISNLNGDYKVLIDKYDFDYYLVSKYYKIYDYLMEDEDLQVLYEDSELVLIKK